jgi:hypothetical protein
VSTPRVLPVLSPTPPLCFPAPLPTRGLRPSVYY